MNKRDDGNENELILKGGWGGVYKIFKRENLIVIMRSLGEKMNNNNKF